MCVFVRACVRVVTRACARVGANPGLPVSLMDITVFFSANILGKCVYPSSSVQ